MTYSRVFRVMAAEGVLSCFSDVAVMMHRKLHAEKLVGKTIKKEDLHP